MNNPIGQEPEFGLLDTFLEEHPELVGIIEEDVTRGSKRSDSGRQDTPSVEQIMCATLYKDR